MEVVFLLQPRSVFAPPSVSHSSLLSVVLEGNVTADVEKSDTTTLENLQHSSKSKNKRGKHFSHHFFQENVIMNPEVLVSVKTGQFVEAVEKLKCLLTLLVEDGMDIQCFCEMFFLCGWSLRQSKVSPVYCSVKNIEGCYYSASRKEKKNIVGGK